jgi:hypothetical protein
MNAAASVLAAAAQAACARLLIDFANAMDCHDHARVLDLFAEEGVLERPGSVLQGRQEIGGSLQHRSRQRVTRHLCTNQAVAVISPERARGLAYVLFFESPNEGGAPLPLHMPKPALVEYRATFSRADCGKWQIQALSIGMVFQS